MNFNTTNSTFRQLMGNGLSSDFTPHTNRGTHKGCPYDITAYLTRLTSYPRPRP